MNTSDPILWAILLVCIFAAVTVVVVSDAYRSSRK